MKGHPHVEVKSAGTDPLAVTPLTMDLVAWADHIVVMEKKHRNVIRKKYPGIYPKKKITCFYIEDIYNYMDPLLVDLLKFKFSKFLRITF